MPPDPRYVDEWFRHAERDLAAARVLADSHADPVVAVLQLQQAIEKALKGYILSRGGRLDRTHDLRYLLGLAADHSGDLEEWHDVCALATSVYFGERYPGSAGSKLTREQAKAAISRGAQLIDALRA